MGWDCCAWIWGWVPRPSCGTSRFNSWGDMKAPVRRAEDIACSRGRAGDPPRFATKTVSTKLNLWFKHHDTPCMCGMHKYCNGREHRTLITVIAKFIVTVAKKREGGQPTGEQQSNRTKQGD